MAWPAKFKADLLLGVQAPQFIVRGLIVAESPGPKWEIRGPQPRVTTGDALVQGVEVSGSRVSTSDWSATTGGVAIRLLGDVTRLLTLMNRGQIVEVLAGFQGYSDADYATIAIGQVYDFTRSSDALEYTLTLRDIWAALSSRISTTADELSLFAGLPAEDTVKAAYTASDATIDVTSSTEYPRETGGNGAFSVVSTAGPTFYITWSSSVALTPGRRYTIVSASALGSTDADAAAGNAVQALAYVKDEPVDVVRKILASTGAGTNGAWDTLPATWGYGIPDRLIGHEDIKNTRAFTRTATTDRDWEIWSSTTQTNGLSWLFGILKGGGWFPVVHQGKMSVRGAVEPYTATVNLEAKTPRSDRPFIEESMMSVRPLRHWSAWSTDHSIEYYRVTVLASGASSSSGVEAIGALPAEDTLTIDLSSWVHDNKSQHGQSIKFRRGIWAQRLPERFEISLADLTLAGHTPGSVPNLTSSILHGRLTQTSRGFDSVPVFVTQVSIDWQKRTMSMAFEVVSSSAADF